MKSGWGSWALAGRARCTPGRPGRSRARPSPPRATSAAERRERFTAEFSPAHVYERYDDLLADPAVRAVVVSLPNFLHHSATISALRAGKHVLCEKPPTMNVAEIEAIRHEATERGLI